MTKASFTLKELHGIKAAITDGRPYADRISLPFAVRLFEMMNDLREQYIVLDELDCLEGLRLQRQTKPAEQFHYPPLRPLWHKHYSAPRHLVPNVGARWNLMGKRHDALDAAIREVARKHGSDPNVWPRVFLHRLVLGGYSERAARTRLTGDWIIFGKHEGLNYYLDLATHEEGKEPERLFEKLRTGNAAEFPFLFDQTGGDTRQAPSLELGALE